MTENEKLLHEQQEALKEQQLETLKYTSGSGGSAFIACS